MDFEFRFENQILIISHIRSSYSTGRFHGTRLEKLTGL